MCLAPNSLPTCGQHRSWSSFIHNYILREKHTYSVAERPAACDLIRGNKSTALSPRIKSQAAGRSAPPRCMCFYHYSVTCHTRSQILHPSKSSLSASQLSTVQNSEGRTSAASYFGSHELAISITYLSMCVCVCRRMRACMCLRASGWVCAWARKRVQLCLSSMHCVCVMLWRHLWPLATPYFSTLAHKLQDLRKKKLLKIKCVFSCLIPITIQRDTVRMWKRLHVKYPVFFLLDFNKYWIFSIDFRKKLKYQL